MSNSFSSHKYTGTTMKCQGEKTKTDMGKQNHPVVASHLSSVQEEGRKSTEGEESLSTFHSSIVIPSTRSTNQKRQRRRRHHCFFHDNLDRSIEKESFDMILTEAKTQMKEHKSDDITTERIKTSASTNKDVTTYRQRQSPTSVELQLQSKSQKQISHNDEEDGITASTIQTTDMSTNQSISDASLRTRLTLSSPSSRSLSSTTIVIETNLSNLSEVSSPNKDRTNLVMMNRNVRDTIERSGSGNRSSDHLQSSMIRLYDLEIKRNSLRKQQFNLEQRLYNLCTSEEKSSMDDPTERIGAISSHDNNRKVVDWKYKTHDNNPDVKLTDHQSPVAEQTLIYTGYLNSAGKPDDTNGKIQFADGQIYEGQVRDGMRHGTGKNTWIDGQNYNGQWNNNSRYGWGTHSWKDGRTVTGTWKNGHLHGRVYFKWPNDAVFDGYAFNGKKEGRGISTLPDGTVYNGYYSRGKEHGRGTLVLPNGTKYRGNFLHGMKSGYGVMLWKDRTYDGHWMEGKPHGQGRVVWSNGTVFTGQFQNGKFHGSGVYVWPSGKKFVGRWNIGVKTGHGFQTWASGKKYDGEYKNGYKEGYGTMTWGGSTYCGGFQRNQRCGRGILTDDKGHVVNCGMWKNGGPCKDEESDKDIEFVVAKQPSMHQRICI